VLAAAAMHAVWNAMLKTGGDRFWWMTVLCVSQGMIAAAVCAFAPVPPAPAWPLILASAAVHLIYQLLLVRTYGAGDFSQAYPIARGTSPLLVAIGGAVVAGEVPTPISAAGIVLVAGGLLAMGRPDPHRPARLLAAIGTGLSIAAYTVIDGVGARLAGHSLSYIAWMSVVWMGMTMIAYLLIRRPRLPNATLGVTAQAFTGGAVAFSGYAIVVWAMTQAPMGLVSALRETSVVFAALIGRAFLGERLSRDRLAACAAITTGGALLALAR
jgi:drug/metabolite transporter (DMT)-like permease